MASGSRMVKGVGSMMVSSAQWSVSLSREAPQETRRYHVPLQMRSVPTLAVSCLIWLSIHAVSDQPSALRLALQPQRGHPTAVVEGLVRSIVLHIRLPGAGHHGGGRVHVVLLLGHITLKLINELP